MHEMSLRLLGRARGQTEAGSARTCPASGAGVAAHPAFFFAQCGTLYRRNGGNGVGQRPAQGSTPRRLHAAATVRPRRIGWPLRPSAASTRGTSFATIGGARQPGYVIGLEQTRRVRSREILVVWAPGAASTRRSGAPARGGQAGLPHSARTCAPVRAGARESDDAGASAAAKQVSQSAAMFSSR